VGTLISQGYGGAASNLVVIQGYGASGIVVVTEFRICLAMSEALVNGVSLTGSLVNGTALTEALVNGVSLSDEACPT